MANLKGYIGVILCLSLLSTGSNGQLYSEIQIDFKHSNQGISPALYIPLANPQYQVISFINVKNHSYTNKGFGIGIHYDLNPNVHGQLVWQDNEFTNAKESRLKLAVDF